MNFIKKLKSVLPEEIDFEDIYNLAPVDLWESNPRKAGVLALKRSGIFDCDAYLQKYPDVRENGIDTIEHYVMHGLDEKRSFCCSKYLYKTPNINKNTIIVSLTSYSSRILSIKKCLDSLFLQEHKDFYVILWISFSDYIKYINKLNYYKKIYADKRFIIEQTEDIKSYKKLIPCLKRYPDHVIVTADDDVVYDKNWLGILYKSYLKDKKSIHAHRVHRITIEGNTINNYIKWKCCYNIPGKSFLNFATGCGGILYPPNVFYKDIYNSDIYKNICKDTDDIWFWAMAVLNNTRINLVDNYINNVITIDGTQENGLWNTVNKNGNNDRNFTNVLLKYPKLPEILINEANECQALKQKTENKTLNKCILSIVIPIFNVESYIKECLNSILKQNFKDYEVLMIDDGSTDLSGKICDDFTNKDKRFKAFHSINRGTLIARLNGINLSNGKYITFIDPDDYLTGSDSLDIMVKEIDSNDVDILQFSTKVIGGIGFHTDAVEKLLNKDSISIDGNYNIIYDCFVHNKFTYNLWNKIYRSKPLKCILNDIEYCWMPSSQDAYTSFFIYFYSKKFKISNTKYLYTYRLGSGLSTKNILPVKRFEHIALDYNIYIKIKDFLSRNNLIDIYNNFLNKLEQRVTYHPCNSIFRLDHNDIEYCLNLLFKNFPISLIIQSFSSIAYSIKRKALLSYFCSKISLFENKIKKVKTIAIFYPRYTQGGVEKVIYLQMKLFLKFNFNVVFITETIEKNEYEVPKGVKRCKISNSYYKNRYNDFKKCIDNYDIDVIIYHALSSDNFIFDVLTIKSMNIPVIGMRHELTTQKMGNLDDTCTDLHNLYKILDALIVLSHTEEEYYSIMDCKCYYMPNIVEFNTKENEYTGGEENIIIWVGRLDAAQKNYYDALEICARVFEKNKNFKLLMLGRVQDPKAPEIISKFIQDYNMQNHIEWLGSVSNMEYYYKKSKIHLVTSSYESFPMSIIESKSFGIPLVTYSMPYLELLKNGKGYIEVEQRDLDSAANAILGLLDNEKLCRKMSKDAYTSLDKFKKYDHIKKWKQIFLNLKQRESNYISKSTSISLAKDNNIKIFIETLYYHYSRGLNLYRRVCNDLKKLK